jgi:hypothetical protein
MGSKVSPQLLKGKVVGARFTPNELAAIEIARGARAPGTWLRDVALAELAKVRRQLEEKD